MSVKNIEAIIFDLDGTIFELPVDWEVLRPKIEIIAGRSFTSFGTLYSSALPKQKNSLRQLLDEAEMEAIKRGKVISGVPEILGKLAAIFKIAVVTRNSRYVSKIALKKLGIEDAILVSRDDVEHMKPDPEGINKALTTLNLSKKQAIFVGDSYHDVEAARAAGVKVAIVSNPNLHYRPEGADYYLDSLSDLEKVIEDVTVTP